MDKPPARTDASTLSSTAQYAGIGTLLKEARERKAWSLGDLGQRLNLRPGLLKHLENENWSALPRPVFVRGFLVSLARELSLDEGHLLELFEQSQQKEPGLEQNPQASPVIRQRSWAKRLQGVPLFVWVRYLGVVLLVGVLGGGLYWAQGWLSKSALSTSWVSSESPVISLKGGDNGAKRVHPACGEELDSNLGPCKSSKSGVPVSERDVGQGKLSRLRPGGLKQDKLSALDLPDSRKSALSTSWVSSSADLATKEDLPVEEAFSGVSEPLFEVEDIIQAPAAAKPVPTKRAPRKPVAAKKAKPAKPVVLAKKPTPPSQVEPQLEPKPAPKPVLKEPPVEKAEPQPATLAELEPVPAEQDRAPAEDTLPPAAAISLRLEAFGELRLSYTADGKKKHKNMRLGEVVDIAASQSVSLEASDGGKLHFTHNGQELGILGEDGEVLKLNYLKD